MVVSSGIPPFDRPAPAARHRPPRDCPVCSQRLEVTQLGCPACGTGLTGRFRPCEFCGLDEADHDVLRVFLASRGNMKDLERHLGVSYPTARARFDDLLRKLGLAGPGPGGRGDGGAEGATTGGRGVRARTASDPDPRLETLRALAGGEVDVETARRRLTTTPAAGDEDTAERDAADRDRSDRS